MRDKMLAVLSFSLREGSLQLSDTSGEYSFLGPELITEMRFSELLFKLDYRPRMKFLKLDTSLHSITVVDHLHPDSLFPILVQPKGSSVGSVCLWSQLLCHVILTPVSWFNWLYILEAVQYHRCTWCPHTTQGLTDYQLHSGTPSQPSSCYVSIHLVFLIVYLVILRNCSDILDHICCIVSCILLANIPCMSGQNVWTCQSKMFAVDMSQYFCYTALMSTHCHWT